MQFNTTEPIYLQIVSHIHHLILTGRWGDGERVPSVRDLAVELEVNPNTVVRSYTLLQEQGVFENQRGIGYFTAKDAGKRVKSMRRQAFFEEELPALIKTMKSLDLSVEELVEHLGAMHETNI
ncbi:MAG: GntR family transcriptional regulator [Sphaerochaeta sp.]|jgi:DNA-binding transcriptional regulator YhcF (GntR family)|nr:GntR family transcriptional regulator [Spirochaetales bacterium]